MNTSEENLYLERLFQVTRTTLHDLIQGVVHDVLSLDHNDKYRVVRVYWQQGHH